MEKAAWVCPAQSGWPCCHAPAYGRSGLVSPCTSQGGNHASILCCVGPVGRRHLRGFGSGRHHLDLLPVEADKGKALAWLLRRLGIPLAATVVAGDSGNDAAMFRLDGVRCILPANAADDLGAVVDERRTFFAAGTDADGVIEGLRRYGVLEASATTGR